MREWCPYRLPPRDPPRPAPSALRRSIKLTLRSTLSAACEDVPTFRSLISNIVISPKTGRSFCALAKGEIVFETSCRNKWLPLCATSCQVLSPSIKRKFLQVIYSIFSLRNHYNKEAQYFKGTFYLFSLQNHKNNAKVVFICSRKFWTGKSNEKKWHKKDFCLTA